jgi:DNA end-binding protein Ku
MAARPTWEGHLRLSLVSCPVRLFKAAGEGEGAVRFHLLNPDTLNRVKQVWKDSDGDFVERKDLVKGYEVERDRYVVIENAELDSLKLDSTKTIDIERFVEHASIDRLYWDQPYYLVPDGKPAQEPYAVIREAMEEEGKVALGRLVMAQRERIVAIENRGRGLLLTTLRSHDEVREEEEAFRDVAAVKVDKRMVDIAKQIIAQARGPFAPEEFRDRYEDAVHELVQSKLEGDKAVHRPRDEPREDNVIDLMEALRRSLKSPRGDAAEKAAPKARAAKAARPAARSSKPAAGKAGTGKSGAAQRRATA